MASDKPTSALRRDYARVYRSLGRAELQHGAASLGELDLKQLFEPSSELILGYYTEQGLDLALRRYGLHDDLQRLGYESLRLQTLRDEHEGDLIRLYSTRPRLEEPLLELVVRRSPIACRDELRERLGDSPLDVLHVEWLQLQHPMARFDEERPMLPGQQLPGLGISRQIFELLRNVARRLKLPALVTTPSYFHNAVFYGIGFRYLDPRCQGRFLAIKRDLEGGFERDFQEAPSELRLAICSWALCWGHVIERERGEEGTQQRADWWHEPMVSALSPSLREYLRSSWYAQEVELAFSSYTYTWLSHALRAELEEAGLLPHDSGRLESFIRHHPLNRL